MKTENNALTPLSTTELRTINGGFFWETEDQFMDFLKGVSPGLHTMVVEFRNLVKGKVDALTPDAKAFVNGTIESIKGLTRC